MHCLLLLLLVLDTSYSTVSENAGIELGTVVTLTLAVRRSITTRSDAQTTRVKRSNNLKLAFCNQFPVPY